jgi:hypothetical protein
LAEIVQKHPDLMDVARAWPGLAPEVRAAIVRMVK